MMGIIREIKKSKETDDKNYRIDLSQKEGISYQISPFDYAMQNIKDLVDQAIDDALSEGVTKKIIPVMRLKDRN